MIGRLSTYPFARLRLRCSFSDCGWQVDESIAVLGQQLGAETTLDEVVYLLSKDCPNQRPPKAPPPRKYMPRCGARIDCSHDPLPARSPSRSATPREQPYLGTPIERHLREGSWIMAHCPLPCSHSSVLDLNAMARKYGADFLISARRINGRLVCTKCGRKGATITVHVDTSKARAPTVIDGKIQRWEK